MTQDYLKKILRYDPETGRFTWLVKKADRTQIGSVAGTIHHHGYRIISIDRKQYQASRLAFLYMMGSFPQKEVDHKNRIKDDDRWENLRLASDSQNMANRGQRKRIYDLPRGVYKPKKSRTFWAGIRVNGRLIRLGSFKTVEEAERAYNQAAKEHFGEFVPV